MKVGRTLDTNSVFRHVDVLPYCIPGSQIDTPPEEDLQTCLDIEKRVHIMAKDRRFYITTSGHLGWILKFGREGDS